MCIEYRPTRKGYRQCFPLNIILNLKDYHRVPLNVLTTIVTYHNSYIFDMQDFRPYKVNILIKITNVFNTKHKKEMIQYNSQLDKLFFRHFKIKTYK